MLSPENNTNIQALDNSTQNVIRTGGPSWGEVIGDINTLRCIHFLGQPQPNATNWVVQNNTFLLSQVRRPEVQNESVNRPIVL